ncbi:MAG: xanthine dehydrogenase family protein molybdopterin-binding subunit [Solirubrobacterales bacterium]|nr:xanthine dehydrogenase family protein molybdopterin-binding subunit [Solirubrobacterales bacterium]
MALARGQVGAEAPRADDLPLVDGSAMFIADLNRDGQLWARVVRSPVASAVIVGIEISAAVRHPGVAAVLTADDVPDVQIPIRLPFAATPECELALQPPLARDRVRYVGEPVAVVLAEDPFTAEDAAELVALELEERTPVLDLRAGSGADSVHDRLPDNVVNRVPMVCGEVDRLFATAEVVVSESVVVHRHTGMPLETRGLLAEWEEGEGRLTVWGAAKVKHFNRQALAQMLDLSPQSVRLIEVSVGGAFGVRGEFYPEDLLVPLAAMRLGRPVKWIEDRREHLVATNHAREQLHELEVAASEDGRLLAFRDRAWCDQGAYVRSQGLLPALLPALQIAGPYAWEGFSIEASAVLTNRTPVGTYRAPGVTEATLVRERALDRVAAELGLDPVELRRRNLIAADRMPWVFDLGPQGEPIVYESGDFPGSFEALLAQAGYDDLRAEQRGRAPGGEAVGIGVSAFCEVSAVGPFEQARIALEDGRFAVYVGVGSVGQGVATVLGQIAAETLGVGLERVAIHHQDTADTPEGFGTFASRSTVLAGNAILLAGQDLRRKAAAALGIAEDTLDVDLEYARLAPQRLTGEGTFEKEHPSFTFGANLVLVSVDRELGRVRVERHLVAHDAGRAVNPALLRGQLCGGAVQGIGAVLFEELRYDRTGQPEVSSLEDYLLATAGDVPAVEAVIIENPAPTNPLGIKGSGEAGMAGAPAAVANAVADALGAGAESLALPLTPARIRALVRARELNAQPEAS